MGTNWSTNWEKLEVKTGNSKDQRKKSKQLGFIGAASRRRNRGGRWNDGTEEEDETVVLLFDVLVSRSSSLIWLLAAYPSPGQPTGSMGRPNPCHRPSPWYSSPLEMRQAAVESRQVQRSSPIHATGPVHDIPHRLKCGLPSSRCWKPPGSHSFSATLVRSSSFSATQEKSFHHQTRAYERFLCYMLPFSLTIFHTPLVHWSNYTLITRF
jgi:hypothetical protein